MPKRFTVLDLLDLELPEQNALNLVCVAGRRSLGRLIDMPDINRPGLALSGFFNDFAHRRIQLFGMGETSYMKKLEEENRWENVEKILRESIPCCIFTHGHQPAEPFLKLAEETSCPVLVTDLGSSDFSLRLMRALGDVFAPQKVIHGVMVEVYGIGVLLRGESGVGKSEAALELIERGHQLISDDAVDIRRVSGNVLIARPVHQQLGYHLEVRGMGIIDVAQLFGVVAIQDKKEIELIVELEHFKESNAYERLGDRDNYEEILGVHIPYLKIPIKPGRSTATLVETAVKNHRLKKFGVHSAQEFNKTVVEWIESENARNVYLRRNKN